MDFDMIFTNFINDGNFDSESIDNFLESAKFSKKRLIKTLFKRLSSNELYNDSDNIDHEYINNIVSLLSMICEFTEFDKEEIEINRKRVKNSRELILYYAKTYNDYDLLNIANRLDEIVIDKSLNVRDITILLKKLIDRKENVNIIKKIININKSAIVSNNSELFGYVFDRTIKSINDNSSDVYYYVTLLKIVYSSKIDKLKYIKKLNDEAPYDNEFSSEIYLILNGCKRGLDSQEILDKYVVFNKDYPEYKGPSVIVKPTVSDNIILSIDNNNTQLRDDAFSIRHDGNYTILSIYIADVGSIVRFGDQIDKVALNNFKTIYLNDGSRVPIYDKSVEDHLSLDENRTKPVITINAIFDSSLKLVDYYLTNDIILVNKNLTYDESNLLLDSYSKSDIGLTLRELYDHAYYIEYQHKKRRAYWEMKDDYSKKDCIDNKSDLIVREFMVLYNELMASIAHDSGIPFIYRTQDSEDISSIIEEKNIHVNDYVNNIIKNIYMQSLYSKKPGWHNGLDTNMYAQCSAPLRKYPCSFNQQLIHQYYFMDRPIANEDIESAIEYFNQRNEEMSLMQSEYNRNYRLIRKKSI